MFSQLQEKIKFVDRYIDAAERGEYERAQIFKMAVDAVEQIAKQWVYQSGLPFCLLFDPRRLLLA